MVAMKRPGRQSAWEGRTAVGPQASPAEKTLLVVIVQPQPA
jgi:hypothetical protein